MNEGDWPVTEPMIDDPLIHILPKYQKRGRVTNSKRALCRSIEGLTVHDTRRRPWCLVNQGMIDTLRGHEQLCRKVVVEGGSARSTVVVDATC